MGHTRQTVQFKRIAWQTWSLAVALLLAGCAAQSVTVPEPALGRAVQPTKATGAAASDQTPDPQPSVAPDAPVAQRAMMYFVTSGT